MRYFLEISYRGTDYHGWQVQTNAHTVQAELNRALALLLRHPVETIGSGRTDTGVHAIQQFVHLDTDVALQSYPHMHQLNALLPPDIAVWNVYPVNDKAHARFDAVSRKYEYRISFRKNPFLTDLCYQFAKPLDVPLMNEAASRMLNHQDFACFSRVKTDVKHFLCELSEVQWESLEDALVFHIRANRFLRGMVRTIVGTLLEVGQHRLTISTFEEIVQSRDRRRAGQAAPPAGLFLTEVTYNFPLGTENRRI